MKVLSMLASLLLLGCGSDSVGTAPTPTPEPNAVVLNPLTDEYLTNSKWVGRESNGNYVIVAIEDGWLEDYSARDPLAPKGFHLWYCSALDNESGLCGDDEQLFFSVGEVSSTSSSVCFSKIRFWEAPPEDFFIQGTANADGDYTGEDVCVEAQKDAAYPEDLLNVVIDGKVLIFERKSLDW